jgi:hypothetical protein
MESIPLYSILLSSKDQNKGEEVNLMNYAKGEVLERLGNAHISHNDSRVPSYYGEVKESLSMSYITQNYQGLSPEEEVDKSSNGTLGVNQVLGVEDYENQVTRYKLRSRNAKGLKKYLGIFLPTHAKMSS